MNRASHKPSGSTRQTEPLANHLDCLAVPCNDKTSQISSAGQGREEREPANSCSSRAFHSSCAGLVHELANTTTAVLMNAQVLGWKLPPYSHLKRPLREIERNAQRGSELMKCLLLRLGTEGTDLGSEERPTVNPGINEDRLGVNEARPGVNEDRLGASEERPTVNPGVNEDRPGVNEARPEVAGVRVERCGDGPGAGR